MSLYSRRPLESTVCHRFLKGQPCSRLTEFPTSQDHYNFRGPSLPEAEEYYEDKQADADQDRRASEYISRKLSQEDLSIALIISDQSPFVIPVWPLPRRSQLILARLVQKARKKFTTKTSWIMRLSLLIEREPSETFYYFRPDSYVVRRSIIQHQVIFSGDGLTLLDIDYIYTFKQRLCTLAKSGWVSQHARQACLASCVQLFHRITCIYTGKPVSSGYIERVYQDIPFHADALDEVSHSYNTRYCTATIQDVAFQPDYSAMSAEDTSINEDGTATISELPGNHFERAQHGWRQSRDYLVSPLVDTDRGTPRSWEISSRLDVDAWSPMSPLDASYPPAKAQPSRTDVHPHTVVDSELTPVVEVNEIDNDPTPKYSPLRISRVPMPMPPIVHSSGVSILSSPPPPPPYPPPPRPSEPSILELSTRQTSLLPSRSVSKISKATEDSTSPSEMKHILSERQEPSGVSAISASDQEEFVDVQTFLSKALHTRSQKTWRSVDEILESPRAFIESWSSGVVRECGVGQLRVY